MSKQEPIHSGHFMTSNPHTEIQPDDEDEDVEVDVVDVDEGVSAIPLDKSAAKEKDGEKPVTFYKFGPQKTQSIAIDVSLNKLNKCIRVAYMKMTTPKWKDFKGLKLQWKHRIRLNNVIWRAYYMEFRKPGRKRRAPYCYFSVPDDDCTHTKIEGSVLEGMYWKRRMEAVCAQYKRWRAFNSRKKRCCRKRENSCGCEMAPSMLQNKQKSNPQINSQQMRSLTPENLVSEQWNNGSLFDFEDDLDNEFTNQLFEQLNSAYYFPNPKEGAVQCANADIMQPSLFALQPSIEEIISSDYPFGVDEAAQLVDPVEFANSLPLASEASQSQPQSRGKQMPAMGIQQQQPYSSKEYDAANMLVDYSNQSGQQQRINPSSAAPRRQPTSVSRQNSAGQPAMPVPVLTPNVSNPLYSQAAVYEPHSIGQQQQRSQEQQQQQIALETAAYAQTRGTPSMSTKIANQTTFTQPITSMASCAHPAQFLSPNIDYSLLVAASTGPVVLSQTTLGQSSLAGTSRPQQTHWPPTWFPQQQQPAQQPQIYQLQQQQGNQSTVVRKTSENAQPQQLAQISPTQISPLALSANSFNAQSLLATRSPSIPYATPLSSLAATPQPQNCGRVQSVLTAHLQQKAPPQTSSLLQSLSSGSAIPQTTVRQFVMSDLSRYLTQQSPIGVNTASTSALMPCLALNTSSLPSNMGSGGLSPIGAPHYSPATTPLSAPIIGAFNQGRTSAIGQPQKQQQMQSQHSVELSSTFTSPPPPKKASTSALPSSSEFQQQPRISPPKKGRASFSAAQRPTHLGKRQLQQQQQIEAAQKQQQMQIEEANGQSIFPNRINSQFVGASPPKNSRRWSSGRRQQSMDSHQAQAVTPLTPPPIQQQLSAIPRRKGQSVCEATQKQPMSTFLSDEHELQMEEEQQDTAALLSLNLHQQQALIVKEEESADEKPSAMLLAPMSHKRRHHSSASTAGASSSHSAPADSTLHPEERKRILHLNAEKNRRSALKEGFECLVTAIPMVEQAGVKCTNAVVLNRAAQHIKGLCSEQEQQQRQIKAFRDKITNMNERIALIQSNLPSSSTGGAKADNSSPTMRIQVEQFFERYKRDRSREDCRFWLMSEVLKPLVNSFADQIHPDPADREPLVLSARKWLDTHWNSAVLRPIASDTLVRLATSGGAFTNEKALSNYIAQQLSQQEKPQKQI